MSCSVSGLRTGSFVIRANEEADMAINVQMLVSQEDDGRPNVRVGEKKNQDSSASLSLGAITTTARIPTITTRITSCAG